MAGSHAYFDISLWSPYWSAIDNHRQGCEGRVCTPSDQMEDIRAWPEFIHRQINMLRHPWMRHHAWEMGSHLVLLGRPFKVPLSPASHGPFQYYILLHDHSKSASSNPYQDTYLLPCCLRSTLLSLTNPKEELKKSRIPFLSPFPIFTDRKLKQIISLLPL